jgi:hypothetical protein
MSVSSFHIRIYRLLREPQSILRLLMVKVAATPHSDVGHGPLQFA